MLTQVNQYSRIGPSVVLRPLLSWCVFVIALALAAVGSTAAAPATGQLPAAIRAAVPATIMLVLAVPLVLIIHRRRGELLALGRPDRVLVGIAVILVCAGVAITPAVVAGWITITDVDLPVLVAFLATNTALALALEALPEELVFRGSIYGSLRGVSPSWLAAMAATAPSS